MIGTDDINTADGPEVRTYPMNCSVGADHVGTPAAGLLSGMLLSGTGTGAAGL
jgi:hypothetical protein